MQGRRRLGWSFQLPPAFSQWAIQTCSPCATGPARTSSSSASRARGSVGRPAPLDPASVYPRPPRRRLRWGSTRPRRHATPWGRPFHPPRRCPWRPLALRTRFGGVVSRPEMRIKTSAEARASRSSDAVDAVMSQCCTALSTIAGHFLTCRGGPCNSNLDRHSARPPAPHRPGNRTRRSAFPCADSATDPAPVYGRTVEQMPEPSDLITAFSPQPGRCFRMIYSHQLQGRPLLPAACVEGARTCRCPNGSQSHGSGTPKTQPIERDARSFKRWPTRKRELAAGRQKLRRPPD